MKVLIDIDAWLLTRVFEPVAWKIELHTGVNCFALARYALTLGLAAGVIASFPVRSFIGNVLNVFLTTIIWLFAIVYMQYMEKRHLQSPQLQNEMKPRWVIRFLYLSFPVMDYMNSLQKDFTSNRLIVAAFSSVTMILFIYFASCNALPPGSRNESRVSKKAATVPV